MATETTFVQFAEGSAPSTPASTKWRVYAKTDGLYYIDDTGTETGPLVDAAAAAGTRTLPLTVRATTPLSATTTLANAPTLASGDMTITNFRVHTFVATTNDGSNYWTITLSKVTAANAKTTICTVTTSADTVSTWTAHEDSADEAVAGATYIAFEIVATKTGAPGNLFPSFLIEYTVG